MTRRSYILRTFSTLLLCSFLITFVELQSYQAIPVGRRPMLFQNYETSVYLGLVSSLGGTLILHITMGNTFWLYILVKTFTLFLAASMPGDMSTQNLKYTALIIGVICLGLCGVYVHTFHARLLQLFHPRKAMIKTVLTFLFSFIPVLGTITYWQPLFQRKLPNTAS
jgi:hypothetical protein